MIFTVDPLPVYAVSQYCQERVLVVAPPSGSWGCVHTHSSVSYSSIQSIGCVVVKLPLNSRKSVHNLRLVVFLESEVIVGILWVTLISFDS